MILILALVLTKRMFISNIVDPEWAATNVLHYFVFNAISEVVVWRQHTWTCLRVQIGPHHWLNIEDIVHDHM